jgi:glutamate dehydrogenase
MKEQMNTPQEEFQEALLMRDVELEQKIEKILGVHLQKAPENLEWLYANLHPYFFVTMKGEVAAIVNLAAGLHEVAKNQRIILKEQEKKLVLACLDIPGSVYETLKTLQEREISYEEITHSYGPIPGAKRDLEIQKFEFDRKSHEEIAKADDAKIPRGAKKTVIEAMKRFYPEFDFGEMDKVLQLFWLNNEYYVRISPPERIARILWLYQQGRKHNGLYLDVEETEQVSRYRESRLLFAVGNPPQRGFTTQISEVFQRLNIGVRRSYSVIISTGVHLYFLGTYYVTARDGKLIEKDSDLFSKLKTELYNTQILSTARSTYKIFVAKGIMTGEEASLSNALVGFCHTSLAHNQPDRFDLETVKSAFHSDPDFTLKLINIFKIRFDPDTKNRQKKYEKASKEILEAIEGYNTGHRYLDEIRRTIFRACLSFIHHTLKTNFFVPEKHALAFRLDPAYLAELGPEFTSDLPKATPFRVTFFFGRHGLGYHIGFSDIARGGWRTIICTTQDEYTTNTNALFREVFVLAHTQHLKNKDIYEGGSKMTVVLDAEEADSPDAVSQRLYKLQYGFTNAFLDIFVTENGKAKDPRVVDYYGEDEPIELGPDENMHDAMIELIAKQSVKRGYLLGIGIMSSKRVGINHKEYGVTSRGVVKFAEIAMRELGVDISRNPFTVKITGGTNGDVAGNAMLLLLERCPQVRIRSIVAGAGALFDPMGVSRKELGRLVLKRDVVDFNPKALHSGGFIIFRRERRQDGLRELHRKIVRTDTGVEEQWMTADEFYRAFDDLIFSVSADLFLPCGGRPETIDDSNWQKMFAGDGKATTRVISEGANSYITPDARAEIQKRGVVVLRDASANKCGVISSSYEIIANLLMTEKEFLEHKNAYVKDVLGILEKRAEEEANLIFRRYRESDGKMLYTDISDAISEEINDHYARLFAFFQARPELTDQPLFRKVLMNHLPSFISENPKYKARIKRLPPKIKYAILASEIASFIVYQGGWEPDFEARLRGYLKPHFRQF